MSSALTRPVVLAIIMVVITVMMAGCQPSNSASETSVMTEDEQLKEALGNELVVMDEIAESATTEVLGITDSLE